MLGTGPPPASAGCHTGSVPASEPAQGPQRRGPGPAAPRRPRLHHDAMWACTMAAGARGRPRRALLIEVPPAPCGAAMSPSSGPSVTDSEGRPIMAVMPLPRPGLMTAVAASSRRRASLQVGLAAGARILPVAPGGPAGRIVHHDHDGEGPGPLARAPAVTTPLNVTPFPGSGTVSVSATAPGPMWLRRRDAAGSSGTALAGLRLGS